MLRRFAFILLASLLISACHSSTGTSEPHLIDRAVALEISRKAAAEQGYDLARYELDTFGEELSEDQSKWIFVYLRTPFPPPPGAFFMVVVDRKTGAVSVSPGE